MTPYQRAAAVSSPAVSSPAVSSPAVRPLGTCPPARGRWPGRADRVGQATLAAWIGIVLAAMVVNRLGVDGGRAGTGAVRTWALDALVLAVLAGAGIGHSLLRRGRPGRWSVLVLVVLVGAVVAAAPALAR